MHYIISENAHKATDINAESKMFNSLRINMNYSCAIRCIKSKGVFTHVLISMIAWHLLSLPIKIHGIKANFPQPHFVIYPDEFTISLTLTAAIFACIKHVEVIHHILYTTLHLFLVHTPSQACMLCWVQCCEKTKQELKVMFNV